MDILSIVISLFALLFAITIHEASHAWSAQRFGEPTAAAMGRVSLNPLAHIDPIGTVILPLLLVITGAPAFGWAKPVMVNPRNLRHPRRDNLWISFAGPAANLTAATVCLLLILLVGIGGLVIYGTRMETAANSEATRLQPTCTRCDLLGTLATPCSECELTATLLSARMTARSTPGGSDVVRAVMFWKAGCGHCEETISD